MNDESTGWGIGETGGGLLTFGEGALRFDVNDGGSWVWTRRGAGANRAAMKLVGEFVPAGEARFGMLCGKGSDQLLGAVVDTGGGWSFVSIDSDGADVLLEDRDAGLDIPVGEATAVALDCAGTATGGFRMQLNLTGSGPIALYESDAGPPSFDRVAAYVESFGDAVSVRLENVLALATGRPDGGMDEGASALLAHVPTAWQESCYDAPLPPLIGSHATALVTCHVGAIATGAELAEYVQFGSKADMDAAYALHVERFPAESPGNECSLGPGEHTYTIGAEDAGRILCAPQFRGIRVVWTDDRLNILSVLVDHEGSYADAYQDWLAGGPNV